LAIDDSQRIIGANRAARTTLLVDDRRLLAGISLWSLFEQDRGLFRPKDTADFATRLVASGTDDSLPALVTPPQRASSPWQNALHTRPRLDLLANIRPSESAPQTRGGLPPAAMRRVNEYVETHLSDSVDLAELAGVAGLSVFHFARQFKQSAGVTPHHYLLQKRVERAQEMLARTNLSLSEIAIATGFFGPKPFCPPFPPDAGDHSGAVPLVSALTLSGCHGILKGLANPQYSRVIRVEPDCEAKFPAELQHWRVLG
jgi:AraC-like DNA-binding protein